MYEEKSLLLAILLEINLIPFAFQFDPLRIKSAFDDSLVHRFSMLLALCGTYLGGLRAIAQLWIEFAQEMRYRVEHSIFIPG